MKDDEALRRLGNFAGIVQVYWDIYGHRHEASPETLRALLAAQGVPARSSSDIVQSLTAFEEETWREALPAVITGHTGAEATFAFHSPAALPSRFLEWTVHLEDGGTLHGSLDLTNLPLASAREIDGRLVERHIVHIPKMPCGYHRLELSSALENISTTLIIAPPQCYLPSVFMQHKRVWGISAQLYSIRSQHNMGMGDFSDLVTLLDWANAFGADTVGVNPLHALFLNAPSHVSPYSPNSRSFLNVLYLDVTAIPDFIESSSARALLESADFTREIAEVRAVDLVDHKTIANLKFRIFTALYENFRARHLDVVGDERGDAFRGFQAFGGDALKKFSLHASLCEVFATPDWTVWPVVYRNPDSQECASFAHENSERLIFYQYLQWQSDLQLSAAAAHARNKGMEIGIYGDLAVSASPDGADVWGTQDIFVADARVGAPPDPFNEAGQEWGVVPMSPMRMRKTAYVDFIALLRANMRHFGALRIDHAMGLQRLFWVPRGAPASSGAYVNYPLEDLLAIVALESQRNKCMVIGEDLGTVPDGFRERMALSRLLSYRVLYFETEQGHFKPPRAYPPLAAACVSTHDLPTLKGFWEEHDLDDRVRAGVIEGKNELAQARAARRASKRALLEALGEAGLLPRDINPASEETPLTADLAVAIHCFLSRSDADLLMIQIDDLAGEVLQANMPGTVDAYPNWRHRMSMSLAELASSEMARQIIGVTSRERVVRPPKN